MANKRIKDISTTATSAASDDFVCIDGSANGTRKIDARPLGGVFDENITTTGEYQSENNLVISADPNADGGSSKIEFKVDGSSRAEITNSGNFVVSAGKVEAVNSGNSTQFSASNGTVTTELLTFSGTSSFGTSTAHDFKIMTGGSERLRVDASGNLLVGATTSTAKLHVAGDVKISGETHPTLDLIPATNSGDSIIRFRNTADDGTVAMVKAMQTGGTIDRLALGCGGSEHLVISAAGTVGVGANPGSTVMRVSGGSGQLFKVDDGANALLTVDATGDVTITGDTSDAYTAGTLKLTAGNLGTNSIQLGDVSDADIGMIQYANSDNSMRLTTNGSERLRVDSSGRLGVGCSSPGSAYSEGDDLVLGDGTDTFEGISLLTSTSGKGAIYFGDGTSGADAYRGFVRYLHSSDSLELATNANTRATIDSSGRLGIGGSPTEKLTVVSGDIALTTGYGIHCVNGGNENGVYFSASTAGNASNFLQFKTDGSERLRVDSSGRVGISNSSPGDYFSNANALVVGTGADAHQGITIATNSDGGGHLYFMDGVANAPGRISYYHTGNNMLFYTNDSERMRLTTDGRLGIGHSSPSAGLHLERASEDNVLAVVGQDGYNGTLFLAAEGSGKDAYLTVGGNRNLLVDFATSSTPAATGTTKFTFSKLGNFDVASGVTTLNNTGDNALRVESTNGNPMTVNVVGSAPNYLFDVRDDGTSKFRVDGSGRVGIVNSSPGSYNAEANNLVVGSGSGNEGITIAAGSSNFGIIYFADGTTGDEQYRGTISYHHGSDELSFGTAAATRWKIDNAGNLVANGSYDILMPDNSGAALEIKEGANPFIRFITTNGGEKIEVYKEQHCSANIVLPGSLGIDFGAATTSAGDGSGTTGTVSNQVLSDYEFGSWTPSFATTGTDFATMTMDVRAAQYVKVGRHVHCQAFIRTTNVDATGATGTVAVDGLPFIPEATSSNYSTLNVGYSSSWVNAPAAGYVQPGGAYARLTRYSTTGASTISASDLTAGSSADKNELIFSISYIAST